MVSGVLNHGFRCHVAGGPRKVAAALRVQPPDTAGARGGRHRCLKRADAPGSERILFDLELQVTEARAADQRCERLGPGITDSAGDPVTGPLQVRLCGREEKGGTSD